MENTLNLTIEGMHCGACVRRVTTAFQGIEGVTVKSVEIGSVTRRDCSLSGNYACDSTEFVLGLHL